MIECTGISWVTSRITATLLALTLAIAAFPGVAAAQAANSSATPEAAGIGILEADSTVALDFPQGLTISADLSGRVPVEDTELELLYTIAGDETSNLAFVQLDNLSGTLDTSVEVTLDLQSQFVPSGVMLEYRWRLVDEGTIVAESIPDETMWFDNRWDWRELSSGQVNLHYYDLDNDFASEILASAQETVTELERRYELEPSAPLEIWIYPSSEDFRSAQQPNSRETIAGASYPGYLLIVAVIPEGSTREIGRVIPHEVSHQVLFQATENPFTYPPLWFNEGMATHFQEGGTDGYLEMVIRANQDDALFDLGSLDVSFPYQPAQATLAYAASWSAYEYIEITYGDTGIAALIDAFATGLPYDEAIRTALGVGGDQLNDDWKAWLGSQST